MQGAGAGFQTLYMKKKKGGEAPKKRKLDSGSCRHTRQGVSVNQGRRLEVGVWHEACKQLITAENSDKRGWGIGARRSLRSDSPTSKFFNG